MLGASNWVRIRTTRAIRLVILHIRVGGARSNGRGKSRSHSRSGLRILAFENTTEYRRNGGIHGASTKHPEDLETLQGRLGLHPRSARDFFDALVALKFLERRWSVLQHPQHGLLSRQAQAILYRRYSRDDQPPSLSVLGPSHYRSPHGTSPERDYAGGAATLSRPCTPNQLG